LSKVVFPVTDFGQHADRIRELFAARALALWTMAGSVTRRKGLVAFSWPMVDGSVGWSRARNSCTAVSSSASRRLSGSAALANLMLARVYSWPQ